MQKTTVLVLSTLLFLSHPAGAIGPVHETDVVLTTKHPKTNSFVDTLATAVLGIGEIAALAKKGKVHEQTAALAASFVASHMHALLDELTACGTRVVDEKEREQLRKKIYDSAKQQFPKELLKDLENLLTDYWKPSEALLQVETTDKKGSPWVQPSLIARWSRRLNGVSNGGVFSFRFLQALEKAKTPGESPMSRARFAS